MITFPRLVVDGRKQMKERKKLIFSTLFGNEYTSLIIVQMTKKFDEIDQRLVDVRRTGE